MRENKSYPFAIREIIHLPFFAAKKKLFLILFGFASVGTGSGPYNSGCEDMVSNKQIIGGIALGAVGAVGLKLYVDRKKKNGGPPMDVVVDDASAMNGDHLGGMVAEDASSDPLGMEVAEDVSSDRNMQVGMESVPRDRNRNQKTSKKNKRQRQRKAAEKKKKREGILNVPVVEVNTPEVPFDVEVDGHTVHFAAPDDGHLVDFLSEHGIVALFTKIRDEVA
jgi:hypothetical protein